MKDYQQKRMKSYVLPEAVYRQALWAVKDLARLKARLEVLEEEVDQVCTPVLDELTGSGSGKVCDMTGRRAGELANLSLRIAAIETAALELPEKYRDGVINKLAYGVPYGDEYHPNTWKHWQQVYLYQVAMRLQLY